MAEPRLALVGGFADVIRLLRATLVTTYQSFGWWDTPWRPGGDDGSSLGNTAACAAWWSKAVIRAANEQARAEKTIVRRALAERFAVNPD